MCNTPAKNIGRSRHTSLADPHHWDVVDLHLRYSLIPPHFSPHTRTGAISLASHLLLSFNYKSSIYRVTARKLPRSPCLHDSWSLEAREDMLHRIILVALSACIWIGMRGENLEATGKRAWDMWSYLTTLGQESTLRLLTAMLTRSSTRQG